MFHQSKDDQVLIVNWLDDYSIANRTVDKSSLSFTVQKLVLE
jgi:hypothetical protein